MNFLYIFPKRMQCSICLESLTRHQCELPCGHAFHSACFLKASRRKMECPLCRAAPIEQEAGVSLHITIPVEDMHASFDAALRARRQYLAQRARLVKRSQSLAALRDKIADARRDLQAADKKLDLVARAAQKEVRAALAEPMREVSRAQRKLRRYDLQFGRRVEAELGPEPPVPSTEDHARATVESIAEAFEVATG